MNKDLIEIAYRLVKEKFPNTEFTFSQLVAEMEKATNISSREFDEIIGSFYTDLLQDKRFIFIGNNQWNLKENLKIDDYRKYFHSLYDYSTDVEEDDEAGKKPVVRKEEDESDDDLIDFIDEEEDHKKLKPKQPSPEDGYEDVIEEDDQVEDSDAVVEEEIEEDPEKEELF